MFNLVSSKPVAKRMAKLTRMMLLLCAVGLFACTRSLDLANDPKGRLTEYISRSFSVKGPADKATLMTYLTGDVKGRLESWSDDQFREAFIDSKREFLKLLFREVKGISPTEVEITYELIYLDQGKSHAGRNSSAKVTNKKLCQMILDHGKWLIADVKNIKELVEYQNELSLP